MRANLLIISALIISTLDTNAQLVANAGPDKVYCWNADNDEDPVLGADIVATGGTAPYSYKWEAHDIYVIGPYQWHYFASDFLNDTTAANPIMINNSQNEEVTYILTVTDANNNISIDTVVVRQSKFMWTLDYWEFTINQGQSIYLEWGAAAYSDRPPFQHYWHPTHGLSDSTSATFWAHPDHSISYSCKVTDALGCYVDAFRYRINVIPVSTNDLDLVTAKTFPNPTYSKLTFILDQKIINILKLSIFDIEGRLMHQEVLKETEFTTDLSSLPSGRYLYRITGDQKKIYSGIIVKK